jgi:putative glutamine amidotransferase
MRPDAEGEAPVIPLIGVTGRRLPPGALGRSLPAAMADVSFDIHFTDYVKSLAAAGAAPVELTRDADVDAVLDRLDGLVISGGADVAPARYGADPHERLGDTEPERDEWELRLLTGANERDMPVLAICRGLQITNVFFGGTLVQHLDGDDVTHSSGETPRGEGAHSVSTSPGTIAATLYGEHRSVNSLHHQGIEKLGDGLIAAATAPDGLIEAFESSDGHVFAVQWHPELMDRPDPAFRWLAQAAAAYRTGQGS